MDLILTKDIQEDLKHLKSAEIERSHFHRIGEYDVKFNQIDPHL